MKYLAIFAFAFGMLSVTAAVPTVQAAAHRCAPHTHWIPGHWAWSGCFRYWVPGHCGK